MHSHARSRQWFKPEPGQTQDVCTYGGTGYTAQIGDYHFGHADKSFQTARAVIAEALAVPDDVEKAARWIFDKSGDWTDLAKANAQKLAEYALRGKQ
jgi:hypothetical protein